MQMSRVTSPGSIERVGWTIDAHRRCGVIFGGHVLRPCVEASLSTASEQGKGSTTATMEIDITPYIQVYVEKVI